GSRRWARSLFDFASMSYNPAAGPCSNRLMRITRTICVGLVAVLIATAARALPQDDLINQARRLDLAGKQEEAVALYRQALDRTPGSFDAHYGIARALDLIGRYGEAREHFAKAIELASEDVKDQALRMMGVSYTFTGDVEEAARYFKVVFDR